MIISQLINGLTLGLTYSLIAVGYSLVFGILRLVNFSYGSVYAFGANIIVFFVSLNFGIIPAIILSMLVTGVLNILIDRIALKPLRNQNAPGISSLITTIGISNIITNLMIAILGSHKQPFPTIFPFGSITIGTVTLTYNQIGMLFVSLIILSLSLIHISEPTRPAA